MLLQTYCYACEHIDQFGNAADNYTIVYYFEVVIVQ